MGGEVREQAPAGLPVWYFDGSVSRVWQCPLTGTLEEDRTELRGMCFVRSHASSGSFLVDAPHSPTEHLTRSLGGEEAGGWDPAYAGVPELPREDGTSPSLPSAAPRLVPSCRDPHRRGHTGPAGRPVTWACPNFLQLSSRRVSPTEPDSRVTE